MFIFPVTIYVLFKIIKVFPPILQVIEVWFMTQNLCCIITDWSFFALPIAMKKLILHIMYSRNLLHIPCVHMCLQISLQIKVSFSQIQSSIVWMGHLQLGWFDPRTTHTKHHVRATYLNISCSSWLPSKKFFCTYLIFSHQNLNRCMRHDWPRFQHISLAQVTQRSSAHEEISHPLVKPDLQLFFQLCWYFFVFETLNLLIVGHFREQLLHYC